MPDIGGGLQALGDIAEAETGAKFDALGGNAKLQLLRDWLSRPGCGLKRRHAESLKRQLEALERQSATAKKWSRTLAALDVANAWSGFADCFDKHCQKECSCESEEE
jgi:hypothetical protein